MGNNYIDITRGYIPLNHHHHHRVFQLNNLNITIPPPDGPDGPDGPMGRSWTLQQESLAKQCADGGMSYAERAAKREEHVEIKTQAFRCEKSSEWLENHGFLFMGG